MRQKVRRPSGRLALPAALVFMLAAPLALNREHSIMDLAALEGFLDTDDPSYEEGKPPAMNITTLYAAVTDDVVGVRIEVERYEAAITGESTFNAWVDIGGDSEPEFTIRRRPVEGSFGVYRGARADSTDLACPLRVSPAVSGGLEMLAPASCLGNPERARFDIRLANIMHGYDYASAPWVAPQADDPEVRPAPLYVPPPVPPGPVTQYSVNLYPTSIRVNWSRPERDGGAPITGYTAKLEGGHQCSTTGGLSCVITGLSPSTRYRLSITARNAAGYGAAGTPWPVQTVPKYTAKVSTNAAPEPVRKSSAVSVSGKLTIAGKAASGKTVTLSFRPKGATNWSRLTTAKTTSTGTYKFKRTATRSGTWRVSYSGSSTATAASATDYVSVTG